MLTAKGIKEKSRLTYEHVAYALSLYRRARQTLRESLSLLPETGMKRIALCGTGEAAELAYLALKEFGIEPVGIFGRESGGSFLGFAVRPLDDLSQEDVEGVVVATFEPPEAHVAELKTLGLPPQKLLTLRRMAPAENGGGT